MKEKKAKIHYQYTYKILYHLQLLIISLAVLILGMNALSSIENITAIKSIIEFLLSRIVMSIPLFISLGLCIDFLIFKKRKHVLLVVSFTLILSLFYLFSFL